MTVTVAIAAHSQNVESAHEWFEERTRISCEPEGPSPGETGGTITVTGPKLSLGFFFLFLSLT